MAEIELRRARTRMCGICGLAFADPRPVPVPTILNRMCQEMVHRGPDERRLHTEPGLGLGFQRLSIIDRQGGHQPLSNEDETLQLVCNGEIYNYRELRQELIGSGHRFATGSDVEVIVHLYEEMGEDCLTRLRGMFAFALWDRRWRTLLLARDRLGIKPLYFTDISRAQIDLLSMQGDFHGESGFEASNGTGLAFASEIKPLLALPGIRAVPDLEALHSYLTFRYVPAPATLFREIRKLPAGHFVLYHDGHLDDHVYWELPCESDPGTYRDEEEAANELISLLSDTVERHLQSEVPVGVFLSGGVDSSAILALASGAQERLVSHSPFEQPGEYLGLDSLSPQIAGQILAAHASRSHTSLESFTLGFAHGGVPQAGFWELDQARVTARRFGTQHHQRIVEAEVVPYDLPRILWQLEEPLGDPGVIPMFYISQMAAQAGVPVVLSGEGADELFAGYDVYLASRIVKAFRRVPLGLREHLLRPLAALIPSHMHGHNLAHRLLDPVDQWYRGVGATFTEEEKQALYTPRMRHIASQIDMQSVVSPFFPRMNALSDNRGKRRGNDTLAAMLYFDVRSSLADDTLLKADRLTMAYSVELRVPFLDHLMVEFAATLPSEFKLAGHTLKYILKKALGNVLPAEILYRKKLGFTAPVTAWMSRDLHAYAETILTSSRFRDRGYFDDRSIRHLLEPATCMSDVGSRQVFTLLVLELWHRLFVDGDRDLLAAPAFEEQSDNGRALFCPRRAHGLSNPSAV